jgi:hypothetical protein
MTSATDVARQGPGMSAAAAEPTSTRRAFLAQAASSAVLATTAAPALSAAADPIFGAIEAHKAAAAGLGPAIDRQAALEREIPLLKRQSIIDADGETVVASDDPRWIDCERTLKAAFDAETDAAIALISVLPTTGAGLLALLQYAVSADTDGEMWPDLLPDEGSKRSRPWHHFLIANIADVLLGMVSAMPFSLV